MVKSEINTRIKFNERNHMIPAFLTFTGIDDNTDLDRVAELSAQYPIEWGFLFSPSQQGKEPRYPAVATLEKFRRIDASKSAHLCGGYSKSVMKGELLNIDLTGFSRVQVNSRNPDPAAIYRFSSERGIIAIMQNRDLTFPDDEGVAVLFDCSGGFGKLPEQWPKHPGGRLVGYAGGISPDNIEEVIASVDSSGPYWLDMETGIRTDDLLDLDKCEAVARAVYGKE